MFQDFLGQMECTLGEIVGAPSNKLVKNLSYVRFHISLLPCTFSVPVDIHVCTLYDYAGTCFINPKPSLIIWRLLFVLAIFFSHEFFLMVENVFTDI